MSAEYRDGFGTALRAALFESGEAAVTSMLVSQARIGEFDDFLRGAADAMELLRTSETLEVVD